MCLAILEVVHRIVHSIGYGGVGNLVQRKAFTQVTDAARAHMTGAHISSKWKFLRTADRVLQFFDESPQSDENGLEK